jgi:hypothetical protein
MCAIEVRVINPLWIGSSVLGLSRVPCDPNDLRQVVDEENRKTFGPESLLHAT